MAKIIDLGNGYGRLDGYGSKYASLIFPIGLSIIRRLHIEKYLNNDEATQTLLDMGYSMQEARWVVELDNISLERWKAGLPNARAI